jgi:hypothetical protein
MNCTKTCRTRLVLPPLLLLILPFLVLGTAWAHITYEERAVGTA